MRTQQILMAATAAAALLMSGCSGTSSNESTSSIAGVLTDSPVAGATYECGSRVEVTDAHGSFACETLPVAFYVGGVKLGEVHTLPVDGNVTPQDLVGVPRDVYSEEVEKIAVFLQSLDDDGDINESIALDGDVIAELERVHLSLHDMVEEDMVRILNEIGARTVVPKEEAMQHLRAHMPPCFTDEVNTTVPTNPQRWEERHQEHHTPSDVNQTIQESVPHTIPTPERVEEERGTRAQEEVPEIFPAHNDLPR